MDTISKIANDEMIMISRICEEAIRHHFSPDDYSMQWFSVSRLNNHVLRIDYYVTGLKNRYFITVHDKL